MVDVQIAGRGVRDERVLAAMRKVPRHRFVPERQVPDAYSDYPLAIGLGQTISQPFIVAQMTELLALEGDERVLEIGTGCGYQAAVLAELTREVHTVELIPELAESARERLAGMGYHNVHVHLADGTLGWPDAAPYLGIVVTAAAVAVPDALKAQLKDGGRLVIPIGEPDVTQVLTLLRRRGPTTTITEIEPVRFVPLRSRQGL
jgi:protein-L-isoaspartate(D-aspartate) O-methyltransferase